MLCKGQVRCLNVVRHNGGNNAEDQHCAYHVEAYKFAQPTQDGIHGNCGIDGHQGYQRDEVKREYDTTTNEQEPEANGKQAQEQLFAVPPTRLAG